MKTANALLVRTVPEPPTSTSIASPEQWTLPLVKPAELTVRKPAGRCPLGANATMFVQALVEVMAGNRPIAQMAGWMSADVYDQLVQRLSVHANGAGFNRKRTSARAASVHVAMIAEDTAEIAARMVQSGRSRAIAIRLERQTSMRGRQQWRCTALTWG